MTPSVAACKSQCLIPCGVVPLIERSGKFAAKREIAPHAVLIGAQLAVASAAILARTGLAGGLSATSLAAWRLTVASALLVGWLWVRRDRTGGPDPAVPFIPSLLIAGICLGIHFAAWFASLQRIPVARSTLLVATTPVWTGLAGWLVCGQRLPARFWVGLAIAGAGVFLLVDGGLTGGSLSGDALAVLGAIAITAYLLIVQPIQDRIGSLRMVAWTYSLAAITLWPAVPFFSTTGQVVPTTRNAWLSIMGMALIPQLLGHTGMNWCLRHFEAGRVAAATLCEPVFAAALAWAFFGEWLSVVQVLGGAVLLAGIALSIERGAHAKAESRK